MEQGQHLEGREVAVTGRLASMSRDEARQRIEGAGGSYVPTPGSATALLVVGQGGPPLGADGRPTRSLIRARELQLSGGGPEIVSEADFLSQLGLEERHGEFDRLYTTEQLARILDVEKRVIRAWVRHGLIEPARIVHRLCFFDFPQVATARLLSRLKDEGIGAPRIRRSLEDLAAWLPDARRALTQLEALEQDGTLVVRTDTGAVAEPSGQLRLDFEAEVDPAPSAVPALRLVRAAPAPTTDPWFERGVDAEERGELGEAVDNYARALSSEGAVPEVLFNLGNALYAMRKSAEAARRYAEAAQADPEYVEAWNNLGIVLSELLQTDEAVRAFRRALALAPDYADAHYNLAETLAHSGDLEGARRHWSMYLDQDPTSPWADKVRERLECF